MELDFKIEGLEQITRALETMKGAPARRVLKSTIRGALNLIGKQMKKDVDPKVKFGRKAVKSRIMTRKGQIVAKVGFGVGAKRKKKSDSGPKVPGLQTRRFGTGVGIGARNIHWWVAGTTERQTGMRVRRKAGVEVSRKLTGKSIHSTGRMPAMQPKLAFLAYQKQAGQINAEMIKRGALQLKKEYVKLGQQR